MSYKSDNLVSGTYECSTVAIRAIEARMEAGEDITWSDELTDEQDVCLMFVMEEVNRGIAESGKPLDPAHVFARMVDVDGTFVLVLDVENNQGELDFRHDEATEATDTGAE